jgi:hypothetical protein
VAPAPEPERVSPERPAKKTPWALIGVGGIAIAAILLVLAGLLWVVPRMRERASVRATVQAGNTAAAVVEATATALAAVPPASTPLPPPTDVPPPTPAPLPPGVFYQSNFDNGEAPGWKLEPGWMVKDGALCGTGHAFAAYTQGGWDDFRETFNVRLDEGQIHFNYRTKSNPFARYFILFDPKVVTLSKQVGDKVTNDVMAAPAKEMYMPGQWYFIEIAGQANHLQVSINKELVLDYVDPEPLRGGSISFETLDKAAACVKDITVAKIQGTLALPPTSAAPDAGTLFNAAGEAFDAKAPEKAFALLDEAVAGGPKNPAIWLRAGDTALLHGAEFAWEALRRYYMPALSLVEGKQGDLAGAIRGHTQLAMYAMAEAPDGGKIFTDLAANFKPAEWPLMAKARWEIFFVKDEFGGVEKEIADLMAKYPDNLTLYLLRGDLYFKQRKLVEAEKDYALITVKGPGSVTGWALQEAQCKAKNIRTDRLKAKLENLCVPLSSLVTGK